MSTAVAPSSSSMTRDRVMRPSHRPLNMANVSSTSSTPMQSSTWFTLPSYMAGFLHELGPPASGVYTFISRPEGQKAKSGSSRKSDSNLNLMNDRRVVRGNTYAGNIRVTPVLSNKSNDKNSKQLTEDEGGKRRRRGVLPFLNNRPESKSSLNIDSSLSTHHEEQVHREEMARARVRRRLADNNRVRDNKESRRRTAEESNGNRQSVSRTSHRCAAAVQTDLVTKPSLQEREVQVGEPNVTHDLKDDNDDDDNEEAMLARLIVARTTTNALLELINESHLLINTL